MLQHVAQAALHVAGVLQAAAHGVQPAEALLRLREHPFGVGPRADFVHQLALPLLGLLPCLAQRLEQRDRAQPDGDVQHECTQLDRLLDQQAEAGLEQDHVDADSSGDQGAQRRAAAGVPRREHDRREHQRKVSPVGEPGVEQKPSGEGGRDGRERDGVGDDRSAHDGLGVGSWREAPAAKPRKDVEALRTGLPGVGSGRPAWS